MDTIYALATARGKAGVAVIRISGPGALKGVEPLVGRYGDFRQASLRQLRDGDTVLDQALVIAFAPGQSFTGEESVELHLHGSVAIVQSVLSWLHRRPGFRLAEPGEFTRRALENGKLDLAQVEGLSDLIASETEAQRRQAMRLFSGELGKKTELWRSSILRAAALLEAVLDFADEDVPVDVRPEVLRLLDRVLADLRAECSGFANAERVRDGFEVAIVGPPNAGKSTLLNRLAGREAALTSEYAGTTRDIIEVRMDLGGLPVTILDTAGLRESDDPVEALGIERAKERAASADLRIFLLESGSIPDASLFCPEDIVVQGKADLGSETSVLSVSGRTGVGVDELISAVTEVLLRRAAQSGTISRVRHRIAVEQSIIALDAARAMICTESGDEIAADSLRRAIVAMDGLVGRIGVEDLLGEVFSSFCIGK